MNLLLSTAKLRLLHSQGSVVTALRWDGRN